ncbi:hypothetical protein FTZ84_04050 [Salmonella enterica]|uniref:Uncharacterized protein n=1 Tax=Salmonella enterica TaxID=28901 RepID=A0A5Z4EGG0_SALER|nr:hypothetical protein [Salmonella enterica subsp. enterica serovar Rubislaw]EAY8076950.1 hypothetical protein [Salmonella enterica]EBV6048950.1 hypothetical protein [Salmonella enterica subsp. enterica serovar Gaminara]ECG7225614.1 hypothetical protein [Salmonella enterica subsp. enterica serovar Bovismorbificans]EDM6247688.1 hypothetical protein [Salmonella enterica subsp. enterica serovar Muenchen]EDT7230062.1 hypothetical protein [Salmonella enterica subsp. enterica]
MLTFTGGKTTIATIDAPFMLTVPGVKSIGTTSCFGAIDLTVAVGIAVTDYPRADPDVRC